MLHIATVHFGTPRWIPIQARQLRRHLGGVRYRTWASIEGIDPSHGRCFDRVVEQRGGHATKLNHLAIEIAGEAAPDDLLMFLDGDAFPVADPMALIESALAEASLLAVRRAENCEDPQPHPCFCVTRVKTWQALPGDWGQGYVWPGPGGMPATDVGANLLRRLELTGTPWRQLLRSNNHDLHPLFFGVYGGVVYHHGAGFRLALSRADLGAIAAAGPETPATAQLEQNRRVSERVFERIRDDDPAWLTDLT